MLAAVSSLLGLDGCGALGSKLANSACAAQGCECRQSPLYLHEYHAALDKAVLPALHLSRRGGGKGAWGRLHAEKAESL